MQQAGSQASKGRGLRALSLALGVFLFSGAALLLGVRVRLAAGLALGMIFNFHFAAGVIFHARYLANGYGPPVLGGLLALALGGARLPLSLRWPSRAERIGGSVP